MKKVTLFFVAAMVNSSTMFSQTLNDAIKQTTNELFETADGMYKKLVEVQPNNGEFYFYYGENFFKNDSMDMANTMYLKGADVNATNPFPYVGLGKIQWYKGKPAEAKANFFKATTLAAGKNATVLLKIAEAYINADTKNLADAFTLLTQATKLEPKNAEVFILMGDAFLEQNDGTKAVENYEKAVALNPKSVIAILRQGQIYNRAKNFPLALDFYKKASLIDSSFAPAYREKAEIYLRAAQYGNAVYNYKRYLDLNPECKAKCNYAGTLFQARQYKEAVAAATDAQKCAPNNVYLYRYLAFSQYETMDYINGLTNSELFFSKKTTDTKIIPMDYEYRAKLYSKNNKDSLAIIDFKKALEMQPEKVELNGDIANAYLKMKKYGEAIAIYKLKIASGKANANDYFGIGKAYYYSKDFMNADSAFAQIIKSQPDYYLGYLWRAKVNIQLDLKNEKWLAKPFYEMYISKLKPEELILAANKDALIGAYNYLAAYYADPARKDCPNVKLYMQKVLELDPANTQAKKVIAGLKC